MKKRACELKAGDWFLFNEQFENRKWVQVKRMSNTTPDFYGRVSLVTTCESYLLINNTYTERIHISRC